MGFIFILAATTAASIVFAGVLRKAPWLFYGLAVAAVAVLFAGAHGLLDGSWWKPLILLVKRCMVALSLFAVVMFIGTLRKDSMLGMRLRAVRSELSIVACILCLGHVFLYFVPYSSRAFSGTLQNNILASFVVAMLLFVLLVILGITSCEAVKKRMRTAKWRSIQRLAYAFFLLTYVHLMFMLVPAAINGGVSAAIGVAVYTMIFGAYVALRLYRRKRDCALRAQRAGGQPSAVPREYRGHLEQVGR